MTRHERRTCPSCTAPGAIPIVFGYPGPELAPLVESRRISLGGCMVPVEVPSFECLACGHAFGITEEDHAAADALLDEMLPENNGEEDVADETRTSAIPTGACSTGGRPGMNAVFVDQDSLLSPARAEGADGLIGDAMLLAVRGSPEFALWADGAEHALKKG